MTRPAIIIGLGGTGQWVLTFIKKDLLELGRGSMPDNVSLLSFDTMPQATAETERQGGDKEIKVGSVKLKTDVEFFHVGGSAFDLATEVNEGKHPHIGSWFQADHYLRALPPASFNLSQGAGQIRQFGRMGIFRDLSKPRSSKISANVRHAFQKIGSVSENNQLEVIIVGSFAGGTGAGMFIDMALLLRGLSERNVNEGNFVVRGFFVLPRAFPVPEGARQREMWARTFAGWRELNRFMVVDQQLGLREMVYNEDEDYFKVSVKKRAYDVCYLIDAVGESSALSTRDPAQGIFPSVADAVSAILDDKAGQKYTEHVSANLSRAFNRHPGVPMYSTMGTYTVKVPVFYVQQEFAHQLSIGMLNRVLAPTRDDRGRVTNLLPNANPENPGRAGADEVYRFLDSASLGRAGEDTIYNTLFLPKMAELMKDNAEVEVDTQTRWAQASLHARRGASPVGWESPLSELGDSPEAVELRSRLDSVIRMPLQKAVPPSRTAGDKPAQAINRLTRQIPDFKRDHVGIRGMGETISRGKFGDSLAECRGFQSGIFRRLLRIWLFNTLEGQVEDPLIARSGKIGYAESFLTELVSVLDRFQEFMRKVGKVRDDSGIANRVAQDRNSKLKAYQQRANRPRLLDVITKRDYQAQEDYLAAEQRTVWLRQDEILHEIVMETGQDMLRIARETRDEVRVWVATLALNPDSVLARVAEGLDEVGVAHKRDVDLTSIQRLVADELIQVEESHLKEALGKFHWDVGTEDDGSIKLNAFLDIDQKTDLRSAPRESVEMLLSYASSRFPEVREKAVAVEMDHQYDSKGSAIGDDLHGKAEPFARTKSPGPEERHCIIRVQSEMNDRTKTTFDGALAELKSLNRELDSLELVQSEDPFRLTVMRSDDMIGPESFVAWGECQEAYLSLIEKEPDQATLLQTFPAEVTAAKYERKLKELDMPWRMFNPKVVMLLEDARRLRQFLLTWSMGFIHRELSQTQRLYYQLVIPDSHGRPIQLTDPDKGSDIFQVMNQFLLQGKDIRENVRIEIRFDRLEEAIRIEQGRLGNEGLIYLLEEQMKSEDGFVLTQHKKARTLDDEDRGSGQAYEDLSDLSQLMFRNMVAELKA